MRIGKAKRTQAEVAQKSRENGDRVERIFRDAEEVEGEVRSLFKRFTQRLDLQRDRIRKKTRAPRAVADAPADEGGE